MADQIELTTTAKDEQQPPTLQTLLAELRNKIYRFYAFANGSPIMNLRPSTTRHRKTSPIGLAPTKSPLLGLTTLPLQRTCRRLLHELAPIVLEESTLFINHLANGTNGSLVEAWDGRMGWSDAVRKIRHAVLRFYVHDCFSYIRKRTKTLYIHVDDGTRLLSMTAIDGSNQRCCCATKRYMRHINEDKVELLGGSRLLTFARWIELNVVPQRDACYEHCRRCDDCGDWIYGGRAAVACSIIGNV